MKVQIQIVTWNSEVYISDLLASITRLRRQPDSIVVIDNNSTDKTLEHIRSHPEIELHVMNSNTGFSYAHNYGASLHPDMDYILCVNPDVLLQPDALDILLDASKQNERAATVSGILIREQLTKGQKISIIDSVGIDQTFYFRFFNRYENTPFTGISVKTKKVIANSGACIFLVMNMIRKIAHARDGRLEIFDEDFFAYKEDVDLGLRVRRSGYENLALGQVIGSHERRISTSIKHTERQSHIIFFSHRNHWLLLAKHLRASDILRYGLCIFAYEITKTVYLFCLHPVIIFRSICSSISLLPHIRKKS